LEKADHAERVLAVMAEFGVSTERYEGVHPWAARLARDADIGTRREGGDMRLSVFQYPLGGWIDAVVMNVLQGAAACRQLDELCAISYQPLAEVFRQIAPREMRHAELGREGLERIAATEAGRASARASLAYWHPRVAAGFGTAGSQRFEMLRRLGLRQRPNEALLADWTRDVDALRAQLSLD
jgi:ring-1,2-phenylacetyl-CoA epoxidase subunit PaaA